MFAIAVATACEGDERVSRALVKGYDVELREDPGTAGVFEPGR